MTTINNKLANLTIYGYIWLLYMVVLLVTPGGGGTPHMKGGKDACQKFWIKPLKETDPGVAQAFLTPKRDHVKHR